MPKYFLLFVLFSGFAISGLVSAQEENAADQVLSAEAENIQAQEEITLQDLGAKEQRLLPGNPFYFLKELNRGLRMLFTFNPVAKAELELRFADEKVAELKKLKETQAQNTDALQRAADNYQKSQIALKEKLQTLKETSQNPNVDRLLEKLTDRALKHTKLFDELKAKFSERQDLTQRLESAKEQVKLVLDEASKRDVPEKFVERLSKAVEVSRGSELKHLRSLEIIDSLQEKVDNEALKEKLSDLRQELSQKLQEDIAAFAERRKELAPQAAKEVLESIPGDKVRRAVILEELVRRLPENIKETIVKAKENVQEAVVEQNPDRQQVAQKAIERAKERTGVLEEKLAQQTQPAPKAVKRLLEEAEAKLEKAVSALEEQKFGEAFGQAVAAEALSRNGLRILEGTFEAEKKLEELKLKIQEKIQEQGREEIGREPKVGAVPTPPPPTSTKSFVLPRFCQELEEKIKGLKERDRTGQVDIRDIEGRLAELQKQLEACLAQKPELPDQDQSYQKKLEEIKLCGPRPGAPGNWVCQDGKWQLEETSQRGEAVCLEMAPACGNSKEECLTAAKKLEERYKGCSYISICQQCEYPSFSTPPPLLPKPGYCIEIYDPVCGQDGKTYSNACFAEMAGVSIKYKGECQSSWPQIKERPGVLEPSIAPSPLDYPQPYYPQQRY